jgi:hypothetical protein
MTRQRMSPRAIRTIFAAGGVILFITAFLLGALNAPEILIVILGVVALIFGLIWLVPQLTQRR